MKKILLDGLIVVSVFGIILSIVLYILDYGSSRFDPVELIYSDIVIDFNCVGHKYTTSCRISTPSGKGFTDFPVVKNDIVYLYKLRNGRYKFYSGEQRVD